jgi:ribosomal protein S6--L-glutamate ligase
MIAETPQAVHSLLETFWAMGQDIVLQEYIRESKGRDIRAIVVGGKVVAAMRRVAKPGEFRSNLHRGGKGDAVKLLPHLPQRGHPRDEGHGPRGRRRRHARGQAAARRSSRSTARRASKASSARAASTWPRVDPHAERYAELHRRVLKHSLDERIHGVIQDERLPVPTRLARTTPARNGKATSRRAAS